MSVFKIFPMILLTVPVLATARAVSEFKPDTAERTKRMAEDKEQALTDVPEEEGKELEEGTSPVVEPIEIV